MNAVDKVASYPNVARETSCQVCDLDFQILVHMSLCSANCLMKDGVM